MKNLSEITITDLSHDGRGVGRLSQNDQRSPSAGSGLSKSAVPKKGKACFIEGGLPGEKILWKKTNSKRSFDEGVLVEIVSPSLQRVEPRCEYYKQCGGCQLQHMDATAQLQWKQEQLKTTMTRAGIIPNKWLPALSTESWNYRRRTRLAVNFNKDGSISIGYRRKQSKSIVAISRCEVLDESLNQVIPLLELLARLLKKNGLTEFELSRADTAISLCFSVTKPVDKSLSDRLISSVKELAIDDSIQLWQRLPKESATPISTEQALEVSLTNRTKMRFVPGQFLQVNGSMNRAMIAQALDLTSPNKNTRMLDLFCGAGNFSLAFAEYCDEVLGVEGSNVLCQQAATNAQESGYSNANFQVVNLDKPEQFKQIKPKDLSLVVLDPPRSGAINLIPWLRDLNAEKILYISCHPATMVRDIELLKNSYQVESIGVMDMFPHTAHLEAMTLLTKNKGAS